MAGKLWIFIDGTESNINSVLAGEALRRAAGERNLAADLEIRRKQGSSPAFSGQPDSSDALLLLGKTEPPLPWAGLPRTAASIAEALENPAALIQKASPQPRHAVMGETAATSSTAQPADGQNGEETPRSLLSALGGWFRK